MNVLALTILVSVCLAGIFICCFTAEYWRTRGRGIERDSLLPLDDPASAAGSSQPLPKSFRRSP